MQKDRYTLKNNERTILLGMIFIWLIGCSQKQVTIKQIVDATCGQCQFNMEERPGCDLAVRINSVNYFVEGTTIDEHGDAHADDGFCSAIRKAEVKGTIKEGKFYSEMFTLLNKNTREDEE